MVTTTGGPDSAASGVEQLRLTPGMVVQELGWDDDVDEDLRNDIMDVIDSDLIEEAVEAVDVVLLWQRDDSDVGDALVDALHDLDDDGYIWLMSPKIGRPGYVSLSDLAEGVETAGLSLTIAVEVSPDWQARKVVRPRGGRR